MASVADTDLLEQIAIADLDAVAATNVVRHLLTTDDRSGEPLYRAFRSWTWQALTQKRREPEMRGWHDLMLKTAAALRSREQTAAADRLLVLSELVFESVQSGEHDGLDDVLQRAHVRRLLLSILAGRGERAQLGERLGLKSANLTRVLNMVVAAGLVERRQYGKHALFSLTSQGKRWAIILAEADPGEARKLGLKTMRRTIKGKARIRPTRLGRRIHSHPAAGSMTTVSAASAMSGGVPAMQEFAVYKPGGATIVDAWARAVPNAGLKASPPQSTLIPRQALERRSA